MAPPDRDVVPNLLSLSRFAFGRFAFSLRFLALKKPIQGFIPSQRECFSFMGGPKETLETPEKKIEIRPMLF